MPTHPLLNLRVVTPQLELHGASDDLLEQLVPAVRANEAMADPPPFDDPMSLYEDDPDIRVWRWLEAMWRGRGTVGPDLWRLNLIVMVDGQPIGVQDLVASQFTSFGTVTSFSWLSQSARQRGLGREMRAAILHLAFAGLSAREAHTEAFLDNIASNRVSKSLGYEANGTAWATRKGDPALMQRWKMTRQAWEPRQRQDIHLHGIDTCKDVLGL